MKLHQLLYFLETAKQQHIGKAAKVLAISPSAISHGIALLEEELGRPLFEKQGKNIRLTSHGKILAERATRLLHDVEHIREDLTSDEAELQGNYKLAASHLLSTELLCPSWVKIQNQNPRLTAEIYTLRSAAVYAGVSAGEYDFGICFSPQSHPSVEIVPIYEGQLVLAVRKGHPVLKSKKGEALKKIAAYPACLPKSYQGIENCETHPVFQKHGIQPKVDLIFDSYQIAVEKTRLSDGWSLLPDWIVKTSGLSTITADNWNAPVSIAALWPQNRIQTRVTRQLIATLKQSF
jgi:DNA-binding transcriptional LysR family regulator